MNKITLAVCTAFMISGLQAQITVQSSDLANVGDTVRVSMASDNPSLPDYSLTGAGMNWDFSGLVPDSQRVYDYRPISETNLFLIQPYFGSAADVDHRASYYLKMDTPTFPTDSTIPISVESMSRYLRLTSSYLNIVGYSAELSGLPIAMPSDSIETIYRLPMSMDSNWVSRGYSALDLSTFGLQYRQYRKRQSQVDGYGSITTPYGTFDAIRVMHTINETDSVYLALDTVNPAQWYGFDLPETREYEWIANGEKLPVLKINTAIVVGFETITSIEYRDIKRDLNTAVIQELNKNSIQVYPVPATDQLAIKANSLMESLAIYSMDGRLIYEQSISAPFAVIAMQQFESGQYILKVKTEGHELSKIISKQ